MGLFRGFSPTASEDLGKPCFQMRLNLAHHGCFGIGHQLAKPHFKEFLDFLDEALGWGGLVSIQHMVSVRP